MAQLAILETLAALPGQCKLCGGADKPWYLDTGTQEEFYGAVVYCSDCIGHIAEMCGFMTPASRTAFESRIAGLEEVNFQLTVKLDAYREIQSGINTLVSGNLLPGGDSSPSNPVLEDHLDDGESSPEREDTVGTGTGTDAQSLDDENVAGLHSSPEQPEGFRLSL